MHLLTTTTYGVQSYKMIVVYVCCCGEVLFMVIATVYIFKLNYFPPPPLQHTTCTILHPTLYTTPHTTISTTHCSAMGVAETLLKENSNKIEILSRILPNMASAADARMLVAKLLHNNKIEIQKLRREIGFALKPMLGE